MIDNEHDLFDDLEIVDEYCYGFKSIVCPTCGVTPQISGPTFGCNDSFGCGRIATKLEEEENYNNEKDERQEEE